MIKIKIMSICPSFLTILQIQFLDLGDLIQFEFIFGCGVRV